MYSMMSSTIALSIGPPTSRSTRTTCWWWAMTRVLRVVARPLTTFKPAVSIPTSRSKESSFSAVLSAPTTPASRTSPPRLATLTAAFAAPPVTTITRAYSPPWLGSIAKPSISSHMM